MQIDTTIELRGNVYHAEIYIGKLTPREEDLISQFGGPVVETGGAISASVTRGVESPVTVTFDLAPQPRRLPDEFPAKFAISFSDDAQADLKVKAWQIVMESRIATAKAALLTQAAAFVGSYRQTI